MKKFAMAAVAALSLSTASAESCASSFSGFYAGVQAGMNSVTGNLTAEDTKTSQGAKSFLGGLFAGYGMGVGSCAYVGGELYTNFANNNVSIVSNNDSKDTFKNTYNMGLKVRLGYTVSQQAMIFLGLGMEKSKWQAKEVAQRAGYRGGQTFKKNKSNFAFAPSVGMDMFVNKNLFIRGEFTYVLAPKMKISGDTSTPLAVANQTAKIATTQQRFTLGLGYKF